MNERKLLIHCFCFRKIYVVIVYSSLRSRLLKGENLKNFIKHKIRYNLVQIPWKLTPHSTLSCISIWTVAFEYVQLQVHGFYELFLIRIFVRSCSRSSSNQSKGEKKNPSSCVARGTCYEIERRRRRKRRRIARKSPSISVLSALQCIQILIIIIIIFVNFCTPRTTTKNNVNTVKNKFLISFIATYNVPYSPWWAQLCIHIFHFCCTVTSRCFISIRTRTRASYVYIDTRKMINKFFKMTPMYAICVVIIIHLCITCVHLCIRRNLREYRFSFWYIFLCVSVCVCVCTYLFAKIHVYISLILIFVARGIFFFCWRRLIAWRYESAKKLGWNHEILIFFLHLCMEKKKNSNTATKKANRVLKAN